MKVKKIIISTLIIFLIVFGIYSLRVKQDPYDELIEVKIKDISEGINELSDEYGSKGIYDNLIIITEIKQDCKIVIDLMLIKEVTNEELAVGDLLGYIFLYIRDFEKKDFNDELYTIVVEELLEVNRIFSRVDKRNHNSIDEYYDALLEEVEGNIERYPYNKILTDYDNRTVLEEYQIKK